MLLAGQHFLFVFRMALDPDRCDGGPKILFGVGRSTLGCQRQCTFHAGVRILGWLVHQIQQGRVWCEAERFHGLSNFERVHQRIRLMKIQRCPRVEARHWGGACRDGGAEGGPKKDGTEHVLFVLIGLDDDDFCLPSFQPAEDTETKPLIYRTL